LATAIFYFQSLKGAFQLIMSGRYVPKGESLIALIEQDHPEIRGWGKAGKEQPAQAKRWDGKLYVRCSSSILEIGTG
jgi:hypothetical protein